MRRMLTIFFVIILFFVFIVHKNSNPKVIISRLLKKSDIESGELRYRIYLFGIFPVGEAVFTEEKIEEFAGQKVYHLNATAQSLKVLASLFSGYAVIDSYIDTHQLNPMLFKQRLVVTGKQDMNKEVFYNQKDGVMSIAGVRRQILPNTQDPLSGIFNVRRIDFDKTKEFEMNINTNQKNYILKGTADTKNISLNKKIYKTAFLEAEISRRDKNPYHKSRIAMVLLIRGKDTIPILIKAFTSGILINAKLIDIK